MKTNKVFITDVTGRDGFQMEDQWIDTEDKIKIINKITSSGIKRIEATSFVSPKAIPQLSDAKEVIKYINRKNIDLVVLVPNLRGAELAIESGVDEVNAVMSVSETHNQKNIRKSITESLTEIASISSLMENNSIKVNVGLATTFGCPFEGLFSVKKVEGIIETLLDKGLNRFILSDTTGMANPSQVNNFVKRLKSKFINSHFSLHLHNTRGMGLVNIYAGYFGGIRHFDASLGGIGGCPFAPGATGNVCTEDVIHMFEQMHIQTGVNIDRLLNTSYELEALLGYTLPGQVMKAGISEETFKS